MFKRLLYLNGLAIISVVCYHASARGFISMFWWTHRYRPVGGVNFDQLGNVEYFGLRIIEQLVIFAIPTFVFMSGYFISVAAGRTIKTVGWDIVLNRIKFLVIPFVVWSAASMVFNVAALGERYSPLDVFITIVTGNAVNPFYYIPMLVQLYLLSPILVLLVRNWWKPTLIISALVQVFFLFFSYILTLNPDLDLLSDVLGNVLILSYIFWFCFGIFVGLHFTKFKNTLVKYKRVFIIGIFFFFIAGVVEWEVLFHLSGQDWISPRETLIDRIYSLFVILTFLTFEKIPFPWFEQITGVSTRSYAIYLIHTLVLLSIAKIIYSFAPSVMEYQILFFPILVFFGLGIPLLLTYLVEKSFIGKYYKYLVG